MTKKMEIFKKEGRRDAKIKADSIWRQIRFHIFCVASCIASQVRLCFFDTHKPWGLYCNYPELTLVRVRAPSGPYSKLSSSYTGRQPWLEIAAI